MSTPESARVSMREHFQIHATYYKWGMPHIQMGHATYTNESCHISNHWKSKGHHARTFANESCHIYEWGMPHIYGRHAMYTNEFWYISHHWKRKGLHTRARRFRSRCIDSSSQRTCSHVAHIQMGHVTSRAPRSVDSYTNKCVLMSLKSMRHVISLHFRVRPCEMTRNDAFILVICEHIYMTQEHILYTTQEHILWHDESLQWSKWRRNDAFILVICEHIYWYEIPRTMRGLVVSIHIRECVLMTLILTFHIRECVLMSFI